ncbi:MAG: hypothetical protein LBR52_07320 [Prevotellaceae bacterium]|jgi:antitoxin component YwqK of YwqJK toxin-antitoxin module|nr:hypothetical protein [Prevotellaceae bacterium]
MNENEFEKVAAPASNEVASNTGNPRIKQEDLLNELRLQQNFSFAATGGALAAFLAAILWASITVATKYQIGYMAIAVGLIVGFAVRFFGAGIDKRFGVLGACLSLFGCLLGNLFSQIGFIAHEYSYGYLEVFSFLDFNMVAEIMTDSFNPMDVLFYGIAVYEGYRFSFRQIDDETLMNRGYTGTLKWRIPLVALASVALIVIFIFLKQGYSGHKVYTYDSGEIMSEGEIKNGKYDGAWTFYRANGNLLSKGFFHKDLRDKDWQWYDENGNLERTGSYENGLETGIWVNYYVSGLPYDSAEYKNGRMNGRYVSKYENGNTYQTGNYALDRKTGMWKSYYENGQLLSKGEMKEDENSGDWIFYFENGKVKEEIHYGNAGKMLIKNSWNVDGNQMVKNGNGTYTSCFEDKKTPLLTGEIKDGQKTGIWKTYFPDGKQAEEKFYENGLERILNVWNRKGEQTVTEGNGIYITYWDNDSVLLTGNVKNGLKEAVWRTYNNMGELVVETEYLDGKIHGKMKSYYHYPDQLSFEGEYVNDLKQGEWKWYNENGILSSSAECRDDKKEGIQLFYDMSGNLVKKEKYKDGELTETEIVNR